MGMKTNEEAKNEVIKAAWGDLYDKVKNHINENGELAYYHCIDIFGEAFYDERIFDTLCDDCDGNYKPESINEIGWNSGWTRIEPDGSNLPTDNTVKYKVIMKSSKKLSDTNYPLNDVIADFNHGFITHYKPIIEDKPPIY